MNRDLPKLFDEFVDARKNGFLAAKEFKENGGKLAGCLCSYTPQELLDAGNIAAIGLCGTSNETIPDAEKVHPQKPVSADQGNLRLCCDGKMSVYIFF